MISNINIALLGEDKTRNSHKRYARALVALLSNVEVGREKLDRIVRASNVPDVVMRLEKRFGVEIPCERRETLDSDGQPCWPGFYWISEAQRAKAVALLLWMWSGGRGCFVWEGQPALDPVGV